MRPKTLSAVVIVFVLLTAPTCFSQQTEVLRYSAFGAFSYLSTPSLNLTQRGFDGDFGVNINSWLTLGGDFSYNSGHSSLYPNKLSSTAQAQLAPILPLLPPGFVVAVPYNSSTYTYEAGPQFNYRHFKKVTLFARPALGALHASFAAKPDNCTQPELECSEILTKIVTSLVGPSLGKSDTVVFYGFGGGATWEITPNFGLRIASDFVHYNYFSGLLDGGRNSVRVVVGTKFSFGKNIIK
ncbi:MAG: hypothetical protein ACLPPV_07810 [Candidatus Korobacteraceae bacterium]|jgi:hypothetical protein